MDNVLVYTTTFVGGWSYSVVCAGLDSFMKVEFKRCDSFALFFLALTFCVLYESVAGM